jgi:hypothetical protein
MVRAFVGAVALGLALAGSGRAHQGPPFPIVMDYKTGPYTVSVWTDPDIGIGRFFVLLGPNATEARDAVVDKVTVCVRPQSGRLPEVCYIAARQEERGREQYYAEVEFDRQEIWDVRVTVAGPDGSAEVTAAVEATPPGFGAWDLLLYGFPFILFGGLWAYAALRRRLDKPVASEPSHPSQAN